jgi:hypothetical protein
MTQQDTRKPAPILNEKRSFQSVWETVTQAPYTSLPQNKVSYFKLSNKGKNIILENAKRTLKSRADILPPFEKLAHPNGICFQGLWEITQDNPYGGYFKKGSKALIIVRASSAMSGTKKGEKRAFGFAGKLFPTLDKEKINKEDTANFFLIDDLGGTDASHYTDVVMSNEPAVSMTSEVLKHLIYGLKVRSAFSEADENPGIRQVYEIAYLGEDTDADILTPMWMKVSAKKGQTVDKEDFRDELSLAETDTLIYEISVTSEIKNKQKVWHPIGEITLETSVRSKSCDYRLHFPHPMWRKDLKHSR